MEYAYATCLLNESGEEINEKNLKTVLDAANCDVQESRVKALVAALEDIEIDSAVDFEELGSDLGQDRESTTERQPESEESDLTDASGMDLVPAESGGEGSGDPVASPTAPADEVAETTSNGAEIETESDADEV